MDSAEPLFAGIDIGESRASTGFYTADGRCAAYESVRFAIRSPRPGWAEYDPEEWSAAVLKSWRRAQEKGLEPSQIAAVGLTGRRHLAFLDERAQPALPAIGEQDRRANAYPGKIRWAMKRTAGKKRIQWVCFAKDYIGMKLCGEVCSDPLSFAGLVRWRTGRARLRRLSSVGLRRSQLPRMTVSFRNSGYAAKEAREAFGMEIGIPVIVGRCDPLGRALGCGAASIGSAFACLDAPTAVGLAGSGGRVLHRQLPLRERRAKLERLLGLKLTAVSVPSAREAMENAPPILPLSGESWESAWIAAAHDLDANALRTAFWEASAYETAARIESLALKACARPSSLAVSGADRNDLYAHFTAHALGVQKLRVSEHPQTAALGAAMLAAVGHGTHETPEDAARAMSSRTAPALSLERSRQTQARRALYKQAANERS